MNSSVIQITYEKVSLWETHYEDGGKNRCIEKFSLGWRSIGAFEIPQICLADSNDSNGGNGVLPFHTPKTFLLMLNATEGPIPGS